ncbi:MAG: sensor histidine kinase [Planctomycetes bacterium]|nr:sensor histidine kinase [Planctomycetota bacterium]
MPQPQTLDVEALTDLLKAFNDTTEKLQRSHERLQARVADLSRELEVKNRELERKDRLAVLGEMAACLAHEIRNPLGGLELFATLLERDLAGDPEKLKLLGKIRAGLRGLNGIVEDMLTYTGNISPVKKPCDLQVVCEEALALAERESQEKSIVVQRLYAQPRVELTADAAMLQRAILNVVLNAVQAMDRTGTLTLSTSVETANGKRSVRLSVSDTGTGISAEARQRLFTPFYTGKSKGTGLGLAIAHRILESHGGSIEGTNNPDRGATFTLRLPLGLGLSNGHGQAPSGGRTAQSAGTGV